MAENTKIDYKEQNIVTRCGPCLVTTLGDSSKQTIITLHDIGLNHKSCFSTISTPTGLSAPGSIFSHFHIVHIDFPGQEFDSKNSLREDIDTEDFIVMIQDVLSELKIENFIGYGVGFGAYCLAAFSAKKAGQNLVKALILVSWDPQGCGWGEWASGYTGWMYGAVTGQNSLLESLLTRYFSFESTEELLELYRKVIPQMNQKNLQTMLGIYAERTDISSKIVKVDCPVLILVGTKSPLYDQCFEAKNRMDVKNVEFAQIEGMAHLLTEECPKKLEEPISLFMSSMGFHYKDGNKS